MGETAPSMQTAPDGQPVQSFPTMRRGSQRLLGLVARRLSAEAQAAETATTQAPRYFTASALRNPIVGGACLTPRSRATAAARLVVESPCHPTSGLARSRVGRPAPGDAAWMWGSPTAQRRLFGFPWASGGTACCSHLGWLLHIHRSSLGTAWGFHGNRPGTAGSGFLSTCTCGPRHCLGTLLRIQSSS